MVVVVDYVLQRYFLNSTLEKHVQFRDEEEINVIPSPIIYSKAILYGESNIIFDWALGSAVA